MPRPFFLFHSLLVLGAWLGVFAALVRGGEPTRSFYIPAGFAEHTLKQFAAQSGLEVLFSTEAARGVRTNAVKGELLVRDAVQRMLDGTPLFVVGNQKQGVLRIARTPDPKAHRAAPKATRVRPTDPDFNIRSTTPPKP